MTSATGGHPWTHAHFSGPPSLLLYSSSQIPHSLLTIFFSLLSLSHQSSSSSLLPSTFFLFNSFKQLSHQVSFHHIPNQNPCMFFLQTFSIHFFFLFSQVSQTTTPVLNSNHGSILLMSSSVCPWTSSFTISKTRTIFRNFSLRYSHCLSHTRSFWWWKLLLILINLITCDQWL